MKKKYFFLFSLILSLGSFAQDVSLYKQFGGHIDFTMIGNTMNIDENGAFSECIINTESTATLNLGADDTIIGAYLYWAGSGTGDFNVQLNNVEISAERTFSTTLETVNLPYFSAFYDVTEQIISTGNSDYNLSDLDLTDIISNYCPNGTNFAGWAIVIVYENPNLPLNQINFYDGLEYVPTELSITLNNIDVIDTIDSKIGFIAWEGDAFLSVTESLYINGNLIGNPPLNPNDNAFNGTNSYTNSNQLFNMDLDEYSIQNNIAIGDDSVNIQLTSGQDFVMINTIITKLNSQLPDATISIDSFEITDCNGREIISNLTVYNTNSTKELPVNTSLSIYANNILLTNLFTTQEMPINGSESFEVSLSIPEEFLQNFEFVVVVNEIDPVLEIRTDNNEDSLAINYPLPPILDQPDPVESCNLGFEKGIFDFSEIYSDIIFSVGNDVTVTFYPSEEDFINDTAPVNPNFEYENITNPQNIYIKAENDLTGCYSFTTFDISVYNCPPFIPDGFSPNGDGINDSFNISGLYDIFTNFKLEIYNRWGSKVYDTNQQKEPWNGRLQNQKELVPAGVYYYILYPNDPNYTNVQGSVYVSR